MTTTAVRPPVCRCGVYKHLHPTTTCARPRHRYWWHEHDPIRHLRARVWIAARRLPARWRWAWADRRSKRLGLCWCDHVDALMLQNDWDEFGRRDYAGPWGCLCDVATPWDAKPPVYGQCYCVPPPDARTTTAGGAA